MQQHCSYCRECPRDPEVVDLNIELTSKPKGCCGVIHNSLQWYECVQWALFLLSAELAVSISLLYWPLFYDPSKPKDLLTHLNVVLHLVNGVVAVLDMWISRMPVRIYHMLYLMLLSFAYVAFTGVYYAAGGGNDYDNGTYIYPQLNYKDSPETASALSVGGSLVCIPLIHMFFYINYLLREGILYLMFYCKRRYRNTNEDYVPVMNNDESLPGIV